MDDILNLQKEKQKQELKEAERISVREERKLQLQEPQGEEIVMDEADDLYFECNVPEIEERMNREAQEREANVAAEILRSKTEYHILDISMMEKSRNAVAPDPKAIAAPENTLLKEEKKNVMPINVIDMKNAENRLDLNQLEEGAGKEEQKEQKEEQQEQKEQKEQKEEQQEQKEQKEEQQEQKEQKEEQQEQKQEQQAGQQQDAQAKQAEQKEKEPVDHNLPEALKETLQSIINDKRSASKYYADVKAAAAKVLALDLNDVKQGKTAIASMSELLNAAILYRDKRSGNRFLKKGKERAGWMDALISGMSKFATDDPVYMYRITETWEKEIGDKKGYPAHLAKWMKKEAEKLPAGMDRDFATTEYAYIYSICEKYTTVRKKAADRLGWVKAAEKTNSQATRTSSTLSMMWTASLHADGSAADEEAEELLSQQKEKIKEIQSTIPAERAKVLNPLIQKYLDMKIKPEMLLPTYALTHMHEWSELQTALTLYDNVFVSDKINAEYLKTLPENVQKKMEFFTDCIAKLGVLSTLVSTSLGTGMRSMRMFDHRIAQVQKEEKTYTAIVKQFSDFLAGKVDKPPRLMEYKPGVPIRKGITYYVTEPIEGMPKNTVILKETPGLHAIQAIERFSKQGGKYKAFLEEKTDLSAEMEKSGVILNDELTKDVVLPADCQSEISARQQTEFWKSIEQEIGTKNEGILFRIRMKKDLGIRNEKLHQVLDTNKDLTMEQVSSLEREIAANMQLILETTNEIDWMMEDTVEKQAKSRYFEEHKEAGREALPQANAVAAQAREAFKKRREEAFIPPKETETKEERDRKIAVFIARAKRDNPDFDEAWGEVIYTDIERKNSEKLSLTDEDGKKILAKYADEMGDANMGMLQRHILGAVLRRVHYTHSGEFATKKDRETYLNNRRILDALANKDDGVLKEEIKKYLYETFERLSELTEEMTSSEYVRNHPEKMIDGADALFFSNVKVSKVPAVHAAYEEFMKEQPEAYRWMNKRLEAQETSGFCSIYYPLNGYKELGATYSSRIEPLKVSQSRRDDAKRQEAVLGQMIREAIKTNEKKPTILKVRTKEELTQLKANAAVLREAADKTSDDNALLRIQCPIAVKAQCGFEAVQSLSAFRDLIENEVRERHKEEQPDADAVAKEITESFTELLRKYGSGEASEGRKEVLDTLTKQILSCDPASFGDLSDSEIVKNAGRFERLSRQVQGYRDLLWQNAGYTDKLKESDPKAYEHLQAHTAKLMAISDYYRIRKMILSDPEYTESRTEIGTQAAASDTASTLHLKEMIALSDTLLERAKSEEEPDEKQILETQEKIRALEIKNLSSNSYGQRRKLTFAMKPNEVLSPSAAALCFSAEILKRVNMAAYRMEKDPDYSKKKRELRESYFAANKYGQIPDSFDAKFEKPEGYQGRYKGLGGFGVADNIARMGEKIIYIADTMGLSKEEVNEWYLNLSVMQTKDFQANTKDEKVMTYMEEAFADACMKSLVFHNAIFERLAETLGQDAFMLHQEDLIERLSEEEMLVLNVASTITNIVLPGGLSNNNNKALVDFVNDYKAKHPFAAVIDAEKFVSVATAYSSIYFKIEMMGNTGEYLRAKSGSEPLDDNAVFDYKKYEDAIGDSIKEEEVLQWFEENRDKSPVKEYIKSAEVTDVHFNRQLGIYLYMHPEKAKKEFFKAQNAYESNGSTAAYTTGGCPDMIELARYGVFVPHSTKELKAYEEDLKNRKMRPQRYIDGKGFKIAVSESDPYLMHDQYAMIVAYVEGKEARKEPVTDEEKRDAEIAKSEMQRIEAAEAQQKAAM